MQGIPIAVPRRASAAALIAAACAAVTFTNARSAHAEVRSEGLSAQLLGSSHAGFEGGNSPVDDFKIFSQPGISPPATAHASSFGGTSTTTRGNGVVFSAGMSGSYDSQLHLAPDGEIAAFTSVGSMAGTSEHPDPAAWSYFPYAAFASANYTVGLNFEVKGSSPQPFSFNLGLSTGGAANNGQIRFALNDHQSPQGNRFFEAISGSATSAINFNETGVLDPGSYFLMLESIAGSGAGFSGSAGWNVNLQFEPVIYDEVRWIGPNSGTPPAGGSFGIDGHWDLGRVPEKTQTHHDYAVFDLLTAYTVSVDQSRTMERIIVRGGDVRFTGSALTAALGSQMSPSVTIENGGQLIVENAKLNSLHAVIGGAAAGVLTAEAVVTGNSSGGWENTGNLAVGGAGRGKLTVKDGGVVRSGAATIGGSLSGEATVTGAGSRWDTGNLSVGHGAEGFLAVLDGGRVNSDDAFVGNTGTGLATVGGPTSRWDVGGTLNVAGGADGSVVVHSGAQLNALNARIGGSGTADARVSGAGSRLGVAGTLTVGGSLPAQLTLENGGGATAGITNIRSLGRVNIGLGSTFQSNTLQVDAVGYATVGAAGTLNTTSATVLPFGVIRIDAGGTFNGGNVLNFGTISNDGLITGAVTVNAGSALSGIGTVAGSVQNFGGVVSPSNAVGTGGGGPPGTELRAAPALDTVADRTLTIDGSYTQDGAGELRLSIAGDGAGEFDTLGVTGNVSLGGKLVLNFDYAPQAGDQLQLILAGGAITGAFSSIEYGNLAHGFVATPNIDGGTFTLTAVTDGVLVPEPAGAATILLGAALLGRRGRRRHGARPL